MWSRRTSPRRKENKTKNLYLTNKLPAWANMHRLAEPRRGEKNGQRLTCSVDFWQRAEMECMLKRSLLSSRRFSLSHSALFFFSIVLITFYQKKDFLVFKGVRATEQERQGEHKQKRRLKKIYWLTEEGQSCDLPTLYVWWMAGRLASQHLTFFFYLISLLSFFSLILIVALCWIKACFLSFSILVPEHYIQRRKLCTARTLG